MFHHATSENKSEKHQVAKSSAVKIAQPNFTDYQNKLSNSGVLSLLKSKHKTQQNDNLGDHSMMTIQRNAETNALVHGLNSDGLNSEDIRALQSPGTGLALPEQVKAHVEPALGTDISHVRVHHNAESDRLSRSLNARAFTVGDDIYFRSGRYQPNSSGGIHLLSHEIAHTLQPNSSIPRRTNSNDNLVVSR